MLATYQPTFSTAAITSILAKLRIDQASVEAAIRRTVADLARQPTPALARSENVPAPAPRRAVRRTVAKVAKGVAAKFPGTAPELWQNLTDEQLAWFRERYPGSLELRLGKISNGQTPINSPAYVVQLLAKYRTRRPFVDKSPDYKHDRERIDGLAYVLPRDNHDWTLCPNKRSTQRVLNPDPILYDIQERNAAGNRIGPPQVWQAEWRRSHFVSVESVA